MRVIYKNVVGKTGGWTCPDHAQANPDMPAKSSIGLSPLNN